jgi:hypothetical protein
MRFLNNDLNFVNTPLFKEGVNYVLHQLKEDKDVDSNIVDKLETITKKQVEDIVLTYFLSLKRLIISRFYDRIRLYTVGLLTRRLTVIEKAKKQLKNNGKLV